MDEEIAEFLDGEISLCDACIGNNQRRVLEAIGSGRIEDAAWHKEQIRYFVNRREFLYKIKDLFPPTQSS